ncbi:hypothetical protein VE02_08463 [Pseudogymnoascus sp. 03VT05]|nr:hypothetical protein VE02_08463 [Pseudogymnoascus sp. 03VT05]
MSWISKQKPEERLKTLLVRTVLGKDWNPDVRPEEKHRHLRMPAIQVTLAIRSTFYLHHEGYRISFRRDTIASRGDGMKAAAEKEVITLWCFRTPYRCGYLFHGPPGTGKTSFIRALAGYLKADIYMLKLSSSEVDDEMLMLLVANLPKGSILLIEDIDSAGLTRDDTRDSNANIKSRITLAGFLNAIDGIASSQGHILIMTTNCRSKLDDAMLRPGRVDREEYFGNASKDTAINMFIRMCSPHTAKTTDDVRDLAMKFAEHIDDKKFSPAQIQGFLQQRRDPKAACADISD